MRRLGREGSPGRGIEAMISLAYAAQRCADAYASHPDGLAIDAIGALRLVWRDGEATIRGTEPDRWANWREDLDIREVTLAGHAVLGPCPDGALRAALALHNLLPAMPRVVMGHSLGGQVAAILAGLCIADGHAPDTVIAIDPPRPGTETLRTLLAPVPDVRVVRLAGSVVTDWPVFDRGLVHARDPLIPAGNWTPDPIEAHSITRAAAWFAQP